MIARRRGGPNLEVGERDRPRQRGDQLELRAQLQVKV
jgi:hypothetical protein